MKFVSLNGRVCRICDKPPRFFHVEPDGSVICCHHIEHAHDDEDD